VVVLYTELCEQLLDDKLVRLQKAESYFLLYLNDILLLCLFIKTHWRNEKN